MKLQIPFAILVFALSIFLLCSCNDEVKPPSLSKRTYIIVDGTVGEPVSFVIKVNNRHIEIVNANDIVPGAYNEYDLKINFAEDDLIHVVMFKDNTIIASGEAYYFNASYKDTATGRRYSENEYIFLEINTEDGEIDIKIPGTFILE